LLGHDESLTDLRINRYIPAKRLGFTGESVAQGDRR
jgi:hypothetical protein